MIYSTIILLKHLLLFRMSIAIAALPTLGYTERHVLETYEDFSEGPDDFNVFSNLTFRFSCEGKSIGLYADLDYDCRIFHVCDDSGKGFPVICPNNTLFDQEDRVCNDEEHVDCEHTNEWFYTNKLPFSMEVTEENFAKSEEEGEKEKEEENEGEQVPSVLPLLWS